MKKDYSIYFFVFLGIVHSVFLFYIGYKYKDIHLISIFMFFCLIIFCIFLSYRYCLEKYIGNILNRLEILINNIIDKNEDEIFSVLNDDLLSKLQSKIIKLINILKAENKRQCDSKNEIKSLISDISHQLKTPFTNLKMYFDFLKNNEFSPEEREYFIDVINNQIEKLNFLIESMIKMTRLESSIINLKLRENSLEDVCLTVIRQVYEKARRKNIEIKFDSKCDLKLMIDGKWTSEAIFNMLDNSVKYTKEGGQITVSIKKYELFAMISIEDNGQGISKDEINNIFKRFYRGKNTENADGVGIGLYLAQEIISRQKGFIKVKSTEGLGSTFSVMLPILK